jgi:hypothetical protein
MGDFALVTVPNLISTMVGNHKNHKFVYYGMTEPNRRTRNEEIHDP